MAWASLMMCAEPAPRGEQRRAPDHLHPALTLCGTRPGALVASSSAPMCTAMRSCATGHRPGYQALLLAPKERRFDAILVEPQDRLWRNQGEKGNLSGILDLNRYCTIGAGRGI